MIDKLMIEIVWFYREIQKKKSRGKLVKNFYKK